jgi:hypothetical protein
MTIKLSHTFNKKVHVPETTTNVVRENPGEGDNSFYGSLQNNPMASLEGVPSFSRTKSLGSFSQNVENLGVKIGLEIIHLWPYTVCRSAPQRLGIYL